MNSIVSQDEIVLNKILENQVQEKTFIEDENDNIINDSTLNFKLKSILKHPNLNKQNYDPIQCFSLRFEKLDQMLAASFSNGDICIFNFDQTQNNIKTFQNSDYAVTSLRWKPHNEIVPKNILLSVSADGRITHWHTKSGKMLHTMQEEKNPIMSLDYNHNGSLFAVSGHDKKVNIYDDDMKSLLFTMKETSTQPGHSNRVFSLCFHKKITSLLASGGWDSTIQFYDTNSGSVVNSVLGPHIVGDSIDLKDNLVLAGSGNNKNQVYLYDIRTFKLLDNFQLDVEETALYSAKFSKENKHNLFAVGGSNQDLYRIYNQDTKNSITTRSKSLKSPCYGVDFSHNGNMFAYGCADGIVRVLSL